MRNFARSSKSSLNSNEKVILHPRRTIIVLSEVLMAILFFAMVIPHGLAYWQKEQAKIDLRAAIGQVAMQNLVFDEYTCLAKAVHYEHERGNQVDAMAIADVVFSRMASGLYPDTICAVTQEVRQNKHDEDVAMFSFIFDIIGKPAPSGPTWKESRRLAAIAFKEHLDGKVPSGNLNYVAPYAAKKTLWANLDVEECKLRQVYIPGAYHLFFRPVSAAERPLCRQMGGRAYTAMFFPKADKARGKTEAVFVKSIPVPTPRPQQDDVANIILAKN